MNRTLIDAATGTPNAAVEDGAAFASAITSSAVRKEVVFIDTSVADYLSLEAAVRPGVEVVRIDGGQDGLAQLATWAQTHSDYDAIHILSHGTAGTLRLGTDEVNNASLASAPVRAQFAALGQALNAGGDLLLYGCDVGAGADGQQLVAAIATATHADVAASTDTTGAASMGGNWSLEFSSGQIDSASVVDVSHQDAYAGVLTLPANGYTTFSNITAPISYGQLASGIPGTLSVSDIAGSGWNLNTYTASSSIVFTVKGVYNNGEAFVRVQGSNISYVDWTLNDSTYTFDLQSFNLAPTSIGCTFTIQAIDSSNNLIAGSAFPISASGTSATAPTFALAEVPAYLTPLYNDIHGFRITLQDAGSYSPMFDNILINDLKQSNSPPTAFSAPSIFGTATLGSLLGASTGTWSDFDGDTLTYSYQWYRAVDSSGTSAAMITGAANSTYMLDAADAHKYVKVAVTANDGQGHAVTSTSGWTAVTDSAPVNTARPTITGTVAVGSAVGAANGSWIDADGDSLTYSHQWFRADDSSGTNATLITGANTDSYTPTLSDKDKYLSVKVTANDNNGSLTQTGSTWSLVLDIPTVTNVTSSDANAAYKAGSTLTITVNMSSAVTVDTSGGTPKLALSSGGTASYSGGSGTSTLTFSYVVGNGENAADLDYSSTAALSLNGATIRNVGNVDANTTLAVPGTAGSLGANKAIVIDTTPPAASATGIQLSADSGASANDLVTNVASQTIMGFLSAPLAAGETIMLSLNNGATWVNANGIVGSSTFMLFGTLFGSDTLKVKLVDAVGNEGSVYSASYVLDTVAPANTIGAIALSSDTGISSTDFITKSTSPTITATLSAALAGTDILYGSLDGGLTWTNITDRVSGTSIIWNGATLGNGTNAIKLKVTDLAGNDGVVTTQSYTLDSVAPTTSIAMAGFSSDTGASPVDFITSSALQTIGGTLSANIAAGETVWVSLDNGSTWSAATSAGNVWNLAGVVLAGSGTLKVKVSDVAGNDGPVYTQAYVLDTVAPTVTFSNLQLSADSGNSNTDLITNVAAQTITGTLSTALAAGDLVYGSVDNGATWTDVTAKVSGTTLSWNGVTLSGSGTLKLFALDRAGNQGAVTAQAYVLDTTAPALTIGNVHISADTGVLSTDFITNTASQTITATLSGSLAAGDIVYGSLDGGATWTNLTSKVSGSTLTWDGATLTGSSIKLKVSDMAGNDGAVASQSYVLDTVAPAKTGATVSFSSDTGTSATDLVTRTAAQTISGTLTAALASGEAVYVSLDDGATWTMANAFPGQSTWSLSGQTLAGSGTLKVKVGDTAGNDGAVYSHTYVLDTTAPAITVANINLSADSGASATDFVTNSASQTISATLSAALGAGEMVYGSLDGGATWSDITAKVSGTALAWDGVTLAGSNTIKLKVSDLAGNDGTVVSQAYTIDTVAPTASFTSLQLSADTGTSGTDFITNTASQTIVATLNAALAAGDTVYGSLDGGATWTDITAKVSGTTLTWDGALLAGASNIKLKVSDAAGNDGPAYTQAYVLDTLAPAASATGAAFSNDTGVSSTDMITNSSAQTISGTLSASLGAGETVYVSLDDGATWRAASTSGSSWSLAGQTLTASGTLKVKVTDSAGNDSAVYSHVYTLDTAAPATSFSNLALSVDTGASASDFVTSAAAQTITATLSGSLAAGDMVLGSTDNGATWTNVTSKVAGTTLAWDGATLTGDTIKLKVVDVAGNEGALASHFYVLDTAAPANAGASIAFSSDTGASGTDLVTRTAAQTITGTLTAALASAEGLNDAVYVSLDDGATWAMADAIPGQTTWSLPGQTLTGSGVIKVKVRDMAGNDGPIYSQAYVLDVAAPAVAIVDLAPSSDTGASGTDRLTKLATPTFNGTAEAGSLVKLYDTDGTTLLGSATADGAGNWSITASAMADGVHDISVTATDTAGNTGIAAARLQVEIDTTAPAAQSAPVLLAASDSGAAGDGLTNVAAPTVIGHGEAFTQVRLYDTDGVTLLGSAQADAAGAWQITTSTLAEGSHALSVKETDAAGNVSAASTVLNLVIDTTAPAAPAAPGLTAASDSDVRGDGVTESIPVIEGTALANAAVELYDGATRIGTAIADASGKWTIAPANIQPGVHILTARQYDAAGNLSGASAAFTLSVVEPATQTSLVDGVQVGTAPVTLPGGQAGTAIDIPIVTPTRVDSSGSPGVADIPLASSSGGSILTAQVAPGYGLSATGAPSQPAASASAMLIAAIKAATPGHAVDDQGHLTGNGQSFLNQLSATQPLLVETVVPVAGGSTAPAGSLSLNGSSSPDQHVALVIDASRLPAGSTIGLQNVDFAAVIGAANLVSDGRSQLLSGDAASQHFTVATGGSGAIYAGGGNDGFTWGMPPAPNGANVRADVAPVAAQTLLHGGAGSDTISFNGNRDSFNIEFHNGYQVVSSKAQPTVKALVVNVETLQFGDAAVAIPTGDDLTTIAGLYQGIYGRQADLYGFEYWADAHQKYGMSWGKMAMMMITQGEWNAHHEALNGNAGHDVEVLYEALFSRKADAGGLDFWVGVMKQLGLSLEQVADYMVQAPEMNGHHRVGTDWDFLV